MPDAPGLELIMAEINRSHPGAVLDTSFDREQPALLVSPPSVVDVLTWLRNTSGQEYTFMSSLHGADYFPREPRFAVHYELMNRERHERLRVKAVVPDPEAGGGAGSVATPDGRPDEEASAVSSGGQDSGSATGSVSERTVAASLGGGPDELAEEGVPPRIAHETVDPSTAGAPTTAVIDGQVLPVVPSCVHLYPTAEFQEREVFDFFGIFFDGHPDMRRILMPEDYVGWPQRRDFPVGGEPVIFTRDEVENPGWWK